MKFLATSIFLLYGFTYAGKPELSFTLKDGNFGSLRTAVAPTVKFEGKSGDVDYGGSVGFASDGLPKSIWGQTTADLGSIGWSVLARAEVSQGKYDFADGEDSGAYLTVEGINEENDTFVWGSGAISKGSAAPLKAGAKKVITLDQGKVLFAPRYNFEKEEARIVLGFEKDDTKAYLTLSQDEKNMLVEHKINDNNSATYKTGTDGFISASMQNESDLGNTKLTYTGDKLDIEIENDGWVAGISSSTPLKGSEPSVWFSKTIAFQS